MNERKKKITVFIEQISSHSYADWEDFVAQNILIQLVAKYFRNKKKKKKENKRKGNQTILVLEDEVLRKKE